MPYIYFIFMYNIIIINVSIYNYISIAGGLSIIRSLNVNEMENYTIM